MPPLDGTVVNKYDKSITGNRSSVSTTDSSNSNSSDSTCQSKSAIINRFFVPAVGWASQVNIQIYFVATMKVLSCLDRYIVIQ